jgi:hypothetical protein
VDDRAAAIRAVVVAGLTYVDAADGRAAAARRVTGQRALTAAIERTTAAIVLGVAAHAGVCAFLRLAAQVVQALLPAAAAAALRDAAAAVTQAAALLVIRTCERLTHVAHVGRDLSAHLACRAATALDHAAAAVRDVTALAGLTAGAWGTDATHVRGLARYAAVSALCAARTREWAAAAIIARAALPAQVGARLGRALAANVGAHKAAHLRLAGRSVRALGALQLAAAAI